MRSKALILSASRWAMADERNKGQMLKGVTVHFVLDSTPAATDEKRGLVPVSGVLPIDAWAGLTAVPGLYEMEMEITAVKDKNSGKTSAGLKPIGVKLVGGVGLFGAVAAKGA